MKTSGYIFLLSLFIVACNGNNEPDVPEDPDPPCESTSALAPCELIKQTWACMNMSRPEDSYNFSACWGREEWKYITMTREEQNEVCQVPPCVLATMSTQAVIQAIWERPLLFSQFLFAYPYRYQQSFRTYFSMNNVYMELVGRQDAGAALLERYVLVDPLINAAMLLSQALELLISQPEFLSQLNDAEKRTVISTAVKKDRLRQNNLEFYNLAIFDRHTTWLLVGRTMFAAGYAPFVEAVDSNEVLKEYLDGFKDGVGILYTFLLQTPYDDIMPLIIHFSKNYLNEPDDPDPPCKSASAPTPCEWIKQSWPCMNMPRPEDSYNFPVCPGMEEWASFRGGGEHFTACQVPPCVLETMSTQAVIQAMWEHPSMFRDLIILSEGRFGSTYKANNTYMELVGRQDAGAALLERYVFVDPVIDIEGRMYISQALEILISQPEFLSQLNDDEKRMVVATAVKKDDLRQNNLEYNSIAISNRYMTWWLVGRTMFAAGYVPFVEAVDGNEDLKEYILGNLNFPLSRSWYNGMIPLIIHFSKNYLNEQ